MMFFSEAEVKAVRLADRGEAVHKDECAYCFDTPDSAGGLLVCLTDHLAFSAGEHADQHWEKTNHTLYLRISRSRKLRDASSDAPPPSKKPTVLGVGMPGGFARESDKYLVQDHYAVVRLPTQRELPLVVSLAGAVPQVAAAVDGVELPEPIAASVLSILRAEDSAHKAKVDEFNATEQSGPLVISKFAEGLVQLAMREGPVPPAGGWKCEHPGCGLKQNLWINLSDGVVMCGRGNFMGLGNGHALEHFRATGFPLAVKLGTLTATEAEVYSYAEDDSVADPRLAEHLLHFGIDRRLILEKTDKTLAELTVDVNNSFEFERLTESGKKLVPAFGPGRTGLRNLGNSCYLNATMQALFALRPFVERYANPGVAAAIARDSAPDPTDSLRLQLSKLGTALCSGRYAVPAPLAEGETAEAAGPDRGQLGIQPRALKTLLGRANAAFATSHQQDALEFLQFLLVETEKAERSAGLNADQCVAAQFRMQVEERLQCGATNHVRYSWRPDTALCLPIPIHRAQNFAEVTASDLARSMILDPKALREFKPIRPIIPLEACLTAWLAEERIDGWRSPETGGMTFALKTSRIAVFPAFLVVQMRRYVPGTAAEGFAPRKLDALVRMPEQLDLDSFRSVGGLRDDEAPLEDVAHVAPSAAPSAAGAPKPQSGPAIEPDPMIVASLESMGFPANRARKAAVMANNRSADAATEWLLQHLDDTDEEVESAAPLPAPRPPPPPPSGADVPAEVETLCSMGFSERHVRKALAETKNDVSRAADWLLSRAEELAAEMDVDAAVEGAQQGGASAAGKRPAPLFPHNDGPSRYELSAIVSHIGRNTGSGHYVAHVRKDDQWLLFNDESVTVSEEPPFDLGFLYFYRRL